MKEIILQMLEILKDRSYEMTPEMNKLLTTFVEDLDREVDDLGTLIEQMQVDMNVLSDCKVVEYAQFITGLPKAIIYDEYGTFKLHQAIENQLQFEMN